MSVYVNIFIITILELITIAISAISYQVQCAYFHIFELNSNNFQPSDVSHLLRNSFLMLLSSISSPFFNGILSLLTILALIWGLVLTIMTFVGLYKRLKPKVKPRWSHFRSRFTKARKPTVSGEVIEEQNMNTEV